MNSKILIFFLLVASGCGVKGDPIAPKSPYTPSLLEYYPDIQTEQPLNEVKKKR